MPSSGDQRLVANYAVLKLVLRHDNLLQPAAFEELAETISRFVSFGQMAVIAPEGEERRLFAVSPAPSAPVVPFGARLPRAEGGPRKEPFFCDDTRTGNQLEQATAAAGYFSYVVLPMRADGQKRVVAEMVFAFPKVGEARGAAIDLLQDIADIVGESFERVMRLTRERRLAMILETSNDAMLAWDRDGRVTDLNAAAAALANRSREQLLGAQVADLLVPVPDPAHRPGAEQRVELLARDAAGATTRVIVGATLTEVVDDPVVRMSARLRDVRDVLATEQEALLQQARMRELEEQHRNLLIDQAASLLELEEQHRTLLDNAPLIIFRLNPRTTELVYLNRHAERLLGVPTREALDTRGFLRAAHADPEGVAAFDAAVARAQSGTGALPYEARLRRRHGEEITARGIVYPLLSEPGGVVAIEGVLADVSAEQAARTRLIQNDRLSTLGTLAAGVAHEINNPAAFILLGLDMLDRLLHGAGVKMEPAVARSAQDLVSELRDSIRRIVDIARDLRLFASPPAPEGSRRTVVDVNRTVEGAISLTRGQILERAQLVRRFEEVPPVIMDDGRLGQVVVNLLVNAAQAIQKTLARDHTVTVGTRSDGRVVEIDVRDTGVGIAEDNLSRIWQPFFTTKGPDGTGLGLSISREIIERAGGTIRAESPAVLGGPGDGARFVISLPAAGRGDAVTPISSPLPRMPPERVSVLVVEDEASLARALAEELGRMHEVVVAEGALRALDLLAKQRFDVVLCDLRMPDMSGEALYSEVAARDPPQAAGFIFMTGVGFGADVERFLASAGRPVLEKPFSADEALDVIVRLLNKREPTRASRG
jgi:PAS domain S-box-containing protein